LKYLIPFITILFLSIGCKKSNPKNSFGKIEVVLNGVNYERVVYCDRGEDSGVAWFKIHLVNEIPPTDNLKDELYIFGLLKLGKQIIYTKSGANAHELRAIANFLTYKESGEMINDIYRVNDSSLFENRIEIVSEIDNFREINGDFQIELVRSRKGEIETNLSDTLRFTQGHFNLKLGN